MVVPVYGQEPLVASLLLVAMPGAPSSVCAPHDLLVLRQVADLTGEYLNICSLETRLSLDKSQSLRARRLVSVIIAVFLFWFTMP